MAESTKSSTIQLPLKLAFTENGSNYIIKNKKDISRLSLVDTADEHGVEITQFSPALFQRLIIMDYVSALQTTSIHHNDHRLEIIDLSKLIIFSKLYQQFNSTILSKLISSDCVILHNRLHPGKCLDEKAVVDDAVFAEYIRNHSENKQRIFKLILNPIHESILRNTKFSAEEKKVYMLMSEKFLNKMSYYNWYILLLFSNDISFPHMLAMLRVVLNEYLPKTTIAEYIALVVLEVSTYFELSNLEFEARKMYKDKDFKKSMLLDPKIRNTLYAELKKHKRTLCVSWKIGGASVAIGKENTLKISVYSKTTDYKGMKETIVDKKSINIRKKTLIDMYKDLPKGSIGSELGLYYLSYLDDVCKQVNVKFNANVNQIIAEDVTFIDLNFKF